VAADDKDDEQDEEDRVDIVSQYKNKEGTVAER